MIKIKRFINELMSSNCYIVWNDESNHCLVIDPGSEKSLREIDFIKSKNLILDYIILTHEHTDHTWGCNSLIECFNPQIICSEECKSRLPKEGRMYFLLYYDDENYHYSVSRVDKIITDNIEDFDWNGINIQFIKTPGHSIGSMCIQIGNNLFTGDTIMQYKPYVNKKNGSKEDLHKSIQKIKMMFQNQDVLVYPGHGESFELIIY